MVRVGLPSNVRDSSRTSGTPVSRTRRSTERNCAFSSGATFSARVLPNTSPLANSNISQKALLAWMTRCSLSLTNKGSATASRKVSRRSPFRTASSARLRSLMSRTMAWIRPPESALVANSAVRYVPSLRRNRHSDRSDPPENEACPSARVVWARPLSQRGPQRSDVEAPLACSRPCGNRRG